MKLEDRQTTAATEVEARGPQGATASFAAEDLDPGRERRPLESYFQEIGGTRTLRREEEVYLAKELEAATAALRDSLYRIPCSSRHVVARWDALRALSHTGAKLSESMGDEETGEIAARVERAVKKLRVLLAERDKSPEAARHQGRRAQRREDRRRDRTRAALAGRARRAARARLRDRQGDAGRPQGQQPPARSRARGRRRRKLGWSSASTIGPRRPRAHDRGEEPLHRAQPEARRRDREGLPEPRACRSRT